MYVQSKLEKLQANPATKNIGVFLENFVEGFGEGIQEFLPDASSSTCSLNKIMARPRVRTQGQRLPRLTENGKLLSNQEIAKNIDGWIDGEFEEELRMTAFLDVNARRQIRLATGVGDIESFVEEFNKGFSNTSQLSPKKSNPGKEAFGESWSNRPRFRKISQ